MNLLSFKNHIRVLALFLMCLFAPMAFAQQPPQPCHITITGDFESQCILPRDKEDYINEEPESLIACQGNVVTYTASTNTGGVAVTQWSWSVAGASSWTDNNNGSITVIWGTGTTGQITVGITTTDDFSCSFTQNVKLIEKPTIYITSTPSYVVTPSGDKYIYVCSGETVEFTDLSATTNTDIVGYYWESDFYNLTASTPNFKIENVWHDDEVIHRVYNNCGCYDEEKYFIKVMEGNILSLGCYGTVCQDAIVKYTATSPICSIYSWYVEGGTIIDGQNQQTVTVQWDNPQNGYGIIGLDGNLCGDDACPAMLSKKIPIIENGVSIKGQDVVCVDEAVVYSIPLYGSTEYHWDVQPNTGVTINEVNGANQIMVEFHQQGTYYITVSYQCDFLECGEFSSAPLKVVVKPRLAITGEDRVCISNACDLKTSPNVSATWQVQDISNNYQPIHNATGTSLSWVFPRPGKYQISATHPDYCRPALFVITVLAAPPAPTINDLNPSNPQVACLNSSILLKANPTNPNYTIIWKPSCVEGSPETVPGNEVTINYGNAVCDVHAYNYDRVLGCLSTDYYTHQVSEFQLAPLQLPENITVCPGTLLRWTNANVPYQDKVIYEWEIQSTEQKCASVQGDNFSNTISLLINELQPPNNYPYPFTVTLTRTYCSGLQHIHTINITIADNLTASLSIDPIGSICEGDRIPLVGHGCVNDHYQWHIQGDNNTYFGNPLDYPFNQPGNVEVTLICNPYDVCDNSAYFVNTSINVNVTPLPPVISLGYNGTNVFTVPPLSSGYNFAWSHTGINNYSVPADPNVNAYSCTITSQAPPYCSITKDLDLNTLPPNPCNNLVIIADGIDYCAKTIRFHVNNPSGMVKWDYSNGGTPTYGGTYNEFITIPVSDVGYHFISAQIEGTPCYSGSINYLVEFLPDFSFDKACDKIIIHNNSKYLNGNKSITLSANDTLLPNITTGTSSQIYATGVGGTFTFRLAWYDGIFINCFLETVSINNTSSTPIRIDSENPTIDLYGYPTTCNNTPIKLTASIPSPLTISSVHWLFGDESYNDALGNSVYHTFGVNPPSPTLYKVIATVKDNNGCESKDSIYIHTYDNTLHDPHLRPQNPTKVCPGSPRKIQYTIDGTNPPPNPTVAYQWSTPPSPSWNNDNSHDTYYTDDYKVTVKNHNFCKAKALCNVGFLNKPTAIIVTASSVYCVGESIKFYGAPTPDTADYSFDWEIKDSASGHLLQFYNATFSYTPANAGTYYVKFCIKLDSTGCSDCAYDTIRVLPTPPAPTIVYGTNMCIDNPPVHLIGSSPTTNLINWSNGDLGPNAYYFTPGIATAWYYDPVTGCKSKEAKINIEPEPNFDALLTGCYEKCGMFFQSIPNPRLPVWGLTSGIEPIDFDWTLNTTSIYSDSRYYPDYFISLPLQGFGTYQLDVDYNNGNCHVASPTLTISQKDTCDCKDLDVSYEYTWYVEGCNVYYTVDVTVCNNSSNLNCLGYIRTLSGGEGISVISNNFSSHNIAPTECYTFRMIIKVSQFSPSSTVSFRIYDACMNCTTDFSIDLMPTDFECMFDMSIEDLAVNTSLSSPVAGYFSFIAHVSPAQSLLAFWSEPPMLINYLFDGYGSVSGLGMIDIAVLSQMIANGEKLCFYAITCTNGQLCKRSYCIDANELCDLFGAYFNNPDLGKGKPVGMSASNSPDPTLKPNPTTGEVAIEMSNPLSGGSVVGTSYKVLEILVMDMNGRTVATFTGSDHFNISNLPSAAYIVRIKTQHDNADKITYLKLVKK